MRSRPRTIAVACGWRGGGSGSWAGGAMWLHIIATRSARPAADQLLPKPRVVIETAARVAPGRSDAPDEHRSGGRSTRCLLLDGGHESRRRHGARKRLHHARAPSHLRREASRRGVLLAGRHQARVPERARAWQPLLPDLRARSRQRRDPAHLARDGQDHLFVRACGDRRDPVRLHPPRSALARLAARGGRAARFGQRASLRLGLRPRDGALRRRREDPRAAAAHQRARLRRRSQLLAGREVDRVLVYAQRLRGHGGGRRPRSRASREARDRSFATSARSTSWRPTAASRGG